MSIRFGVSPIAWANDDMPELGGIGAVWIRAREQPGTVRIKATHPRLGERQAVIEIVAAPPELA